MERKIKNTLPEPEDTIIIKEEIKEECIPEKPEDMCARNREKERKPKIISEKSRLGMRERARRRRMRYTEEQKARNRENSRRLYMRLTEEQKLLKVIRKRELRQQRKMLLTEEEKLIAKNRKQEERDLLQKSPSDLSPEERERRDKILEKRNHKAIHEMNRRAHMTEEQKERIRINDYFRHQAQKHTRSEEEKQRLREYARHKMLEHYHKYKNDPERKKRSNEYSKKKQKIRLEKIQKGILVIPPEKRRRQLHVYKVNAAKQKLKKKLQSEGVHEEEIKKRLKELYDEMWKAFNELPPPDPETVSVYKPRPRKNKKQQERIEADPVHVQVQHHPPQVQTLRRNVPLEEHHASAAQDDVENETDDFSDNELNDHFDDGDNQSCTHSPSPDTDLETSSNNYNEFVEANNETETTVPPEPITPMDLQRLCKDRQETLSEHVPEETLELTKCSHCMEKFVNDHDLREHTFQSHLSKCWRCPICKEFSLTPAEFTEHFQKSHSSTNQSSTSQRASEETMTSKSNSLKFSCFVCSKEFVSQNELGSHVEIQHPTRYFPCQYCDILRYSEKSLILHIKNCGKKRCKMKNL